MERLDCTGYLAQPERQQYVPVTLTVPKNNRMALMAQAQRANFGGDVNVSVEGLPAGLTAPLWHDGRRGGAHVHAT